ncbi:M20/M25/M40 family metallo-hydrolase [Porphyrobacter sp. LM 6]|uniref:M20/M25/M40 family metallo-hydrolase n=1 Tax=Porphyrobacter sp. LM 6 TaxID=1896196 RepID=UPI0008464E6B|nr:M20/M25/M40 family metallo-hydrolase [Porphyrobacter sp. LM 6]AOL94061.1 Acetylornithine deacetylase/Succinyl-diaminopimelate desuccinylase [Porphyrobacter sp. LM 6]
MTKAFTALALAATLLASGGAAHAADRAPPTADQQVALDIYRDIIAIRTARGQAKTPEMVAYLVSRLKQAGFADADIMVSDYDSAGERVQGLIVRYAAAKPDGRKPIVLLAHMDVVDALEQDWVLPPFTLTEKDGYFFGRGTTDNKYGVTNLTQTFIRLKKEGWKPTRDLYLVFSGDEETGMISTRAQADYVASKIDPAYVLNSDAGGITLASDNRPLAMAVQAAEKTFATFEMTVTNPGGHSSRPRSDNAIYELSDALQKIAAYRFPVQATPLTRSFLGALGQITPGEVGAAMRAFSANPADEAAIAVLRANPETVGTLGTTCVATMLKAGHAENALPQSATATVNCRIFPGVGAAATEATLRKVVANDAVQFKLLTDVTESPESAVPTEVMAALRKTIDARYPGLPIQPYMESGGTDGMHYRARGYQTVAISGAASRPEDMYAHGLNERLSVDAFDGGLDHWYRLLKELAR